MKVGRWMIAISASAMAACVSEPTEPPPVVLDHDQVVLDFIEVRGLEEVARMRGTERRRFQKFTPSYIIYKVRRDEFLVEFDRPCYEIWDNAFFSADDTLLHNTLRARYDRIRGCRINRIFELTDDDLYDLKQLGVGVGSGN